VQFLTKLSNSGVRDGVTDIVDREEQLEKA